MLQRDVPDDFVIATGHCHLLEEFTAAVFKELDLDWHDHVVQDTSLFRPTDLRQSLGNPAKARKVLGWVAQHVMHDVVRMMIAAERAGSPLVCAE